MNAVTEGRSPQRTVPDRTQDRADRRTHDAQTDHDPQEIPERDEGVERRVGVESDGRKTEMEARRRNAWQAVLPASVLRERVEFDEVEDLGDCYRDHGEIDAGTSQCDQADEEP